MNGNPVGSARPSAWLAIPALPSRKAQAIGDGPLGASSKPGASVGATEAIASVYACRLARMPLGCMMRIACAADAGSAAECVVLSLGRIHPKKGLSRLVHAWSQVEAGHCLKPRFAFH